MVVEFHGMRLLGEDEGFRKRAQRIFSKLYESHTVIHLHANNFAEMYIIKGIPNPDVIERAFSIRRNYRFSPYYQRFPEPLDAPNDLDQLDLILGSLSF
jgi:hypothetical protein